MLYFASLTSSYAFLTFLFTNMLFPHTITTTYHRNRNCNRFPRFCTFLTESLSTFLFLSIPHYYSSSSSPRSSNLEHDAAVASFNRMLHARPSPPVFHFNKLLAAFVRMKRYPTAISLCTEMRLKVCNCIWYGENADVMIEE